MIAQTARTHERELPHRRNAARLRLCLPAELVLVSGHYDCVMENVSTTGARIICDAPMREGRNGILRCSPLEALFSIVWVEGKAAGLRFEEEIGLGIIRMLRWNNDHFRQINERQVRQMVRDWVEGKTS